MMKLYENIRFYRRQAKLTQDELAALSGYTDRSSIAKIEKGLVDLSQTKIKQFADIFGVTPSTLMGWEGEEEQQKPANDEDGLTESHQKLIAFAKTLSEEQAEKVLRVMQSIVGDNP